MTPEEIRSAIDYLDACIAEIHTGAEGRALDADEQTRFDAGLAERARLVALAERHKVVADLVRSRPEAVQPGAPFTAPNVIVRDADPFDLTELRFNAPVGEIRDRALSAIEKVSNLTDRDRESAERTLRHVDTRDGKVAKHMLATGSDAYRQAFIKAASGDQALFTEAERNAVEVARAASLTSNAGGYAVPFVLDPTIIDTGSHTVNPFRAISRRVQSVANVWHGVSSAGVTASWDAEGAEVSDDAPTLAQPAITCYKGQAFVPFSVEIEGDWAAIESDLRTMIMQGKDDLEGAAFATGSGSSQPFGIVTAIAGGSYEVASAASEAFSQADVYALESSLDARFRTRASFVANKTWYNKVRQFDTAGGAGLWERIGAAQPPQLLGYNAYESSNMDSVLPDAAATANNYGIVLGDFSNYVIVDRVGMSIELVPHLLHTSNNLPSGKRGFLAWWRVGADSVNDAAFRLLNVATAA